MDDVRRPNLAAGAGLLSCLLLLALVCCAVPGDSDRDSGTDSDAEPDGDTDADTDADAESDADGDSDIDADSDTDQDADDPDCPDADRDGVCDPEDVCAGGDDRVDSDDDGYPDDCDCDGGAVECDEDAACVDDGDGPACVCDEGYEGDGVACSDVDECAEEPGPCDRNATCENTEGGFECTCDTGYSGDGFSCTPTSDVPCRYANLGDGYDDDRSMGGPGLFFAIRFTATLAQRIGRCEVFTGEGIGWNTIGIWSNDPSTEVPRTVLGSGSWEMLFANQWQGVDLSTPVETVIGNDYWIVWSPIDGTQASMDVAGTTVEYRGSFDGGSSWSGRFFVPIKYRCYCE